MSLQQCQSVCVPVREHISGTAYASDIHQFMLPMAVARSILFSRRCDASCTSGVMDDVIFADNEPWRHVDIVARVAQLWRYAQANAPAASQWLCYGVLDDGGHRD